MSKVEYLVILGRVKHDGKSAYVDHRWDGRRFNERVHAITHGLGEVGSDDFNIGVLTDGKLTSYDWMDEPLGEDEYTLNAISNDIGLTQ